MAKKAVQVRAIALGFRNGSRVPKGAVFTLTLDDGQDLPKWVEVVDAKAEAKAPTPVVKNAPRTLSEMGKAIEAARVKKADPPEAMK